MKNLLHIFIIAYILFVSESQSQTPQILWWFDTNDSAFGQSAMADINNDGIPDVVFGCYRNDSMIYALRASDGALLWKFNASGSGEGCNDVAPLIYDIDGDGYPEVIVPSSCNPKTFCFDGATGAIKWQTPTRGSDSPPTIADLDGDGFPEILHGEFGGYVICINAHNGSVKWEIAVDVNSWIQTAPSIVDLDGDNLPDFVVSTWHFSNNNKIYAYRGYDQALLWSRNLDDVVYHGTAITDLNKDGQPELIFGDYSGTLHVLKGATGDTLWTFNTGAYIGSPVSVGDLNGDGYCEIVFTSWYKVYALRHDGTILWQYNIPGYNQSFRGAALSDMDNDMLPDVIFGTSGGQVISLKGTTGQPLWNIDLAAHYGSTLKFDHAPVLGYFNNNNLPDIFIVGGNTDYPNFQNNYGRAYAIESPSGTGPEWPMFQYDVRRTGNLCSVQHAHIPEITPIETLFFPNPAMPGQMLYFKNIIGFQPQNVRILDITGKLIFTEDANYNQIRLPSYMETGIYFIYVTAGTEKICRKIVIQ